MASPTTFPRFLELPKEVRIQIWKHAAYRESNAPINAFIFSCRNYGFGTTADVFRAFVLWAKFNYDIEVGRTLRDRFHLMGTCALARLICVEVWRDDIHLVPKPGEIPGIVVGPVNSKDVPRAKAVIAMLFDVFDALIKKLKDGSTA